MATVKNIVHSRRYMWPCTCRCSDAHACVSAFIRAYTVGIYSNGEAPRPSYWNLTKERRVKNIMKIKIFAAKIAYEIPDTKQHRTLRKWNEINVRALTVKKISAFLHLIFWNYCIHYTLGIGIRIHWRITNNNSSLLITVIGSKEIIIKNTIMIFNRSSEKCQFLKSVPNFSIAV